jgi:hypothetical protein
MEFKIDLQARVAKNSLLLAEYWIRELRMECMNGFRVPIFSTDVRNMEGNIDSLIGIR